MKEQLRQAQRFGFGYTTGSQDILTHNTNVDLNHRFVIFNLKRDLSHKLKRSLWLFRVYLESNCRNRKCTMGVRENANSV